MKTNHIPLSFIRGLTPLIRPSQWMKYFLLGSCILLLASCVRVVDLQKGLQDTEANEIIALLNRYGIDVKKQATKDGVTLTVEDAEKIRATELMQAADLPKRSLSALGGDLKKEGTASALLEEKARYFHGLSQELEYTLQMFDNVMSARVQVVLPQQVMPGEPIHPSSATVFIKYREPFDTAANASRMQHLVLASLPGLSSGRAEDRSKVSIVFAPGVAAPRQPSWASVGPFKVEEKSAASLRQSLAFLALIAAMSSLLLLLAISLRFAKAAQVLEKVLPKRIYLFLGSQGGVLQK